MTFTVFDEQEIMDGGYSRGLRRGVKSGRAAKFTRRRAARNGHVVYRAVIDCDDMPDDL